MVGYDFSNELNKNMFMSACFSNYSNLYKEDKDYYVAVPCKDLVVKFLDFLNKEIKNFSIDLIESEISKELGIELYYFKINVSEEYNELSRYIIKYMCGIFLNQFSIQEGFIKNENPEVCDWEFLAKINNKRRNNTNHIIYDCGNENLKSEWLSKFDDIEFCNEIAFKEPFSEHGSWGDYKTDIYVGKRVTQTTVMNRIKNCLRK